MKFNKFLIGLTAAIALMAGTAQADTSIGVLSGPIAYVNSSLGVQTNVGLSLATNGMYSQAILGTAQLSETNIEPLTPAGATGNQLVITFQASATATPNATNVWVYLDAAPNNLTLTNSTTGGNAGTLQPYQQSWGVVTLALPTTAVGTVLAQTNLVLNPYTTPQYNQGLRLYVDHITTGVLGSGIYLTNYSVLVQQVP